MAFFCNQTSHHIICADSYCQKTSHGLVKPAVVDLLRTMDSLWLSSHQTMGVFFCDSLDLCYDPCHVIKHDQKARID